MNKKHFRMIFHDGRDTNAAEALYPGQLWIRNDAATAGTLTASERGAVRLAVMDVNGKHPTEQTLAVGESVSVSAGGFVVLLTNTDVANLVPPTFACAVGGDLRKDTGVYYDGTRGAMQEWTTLTEAGALTLGETLATSCYYAMFRGCTSLVTAPALPATTLATDCYRAMFYGCGFVTSHDVATLTSNSGAGMFTNNNSCLSLTMRAVTPPTIGSGYLNGLPATCAIYVPAESVDAYKEAAVWSARADYIQAIPSEVAE